MNKECRICNELANKNYDLLNKLELKSTILAENENWAILPALGSVVNGYIMIVNKCHYNSIATCPEKQYEELEKIINICREVLESVFKKKCIFFEHGSLSASTPGSNSIDHIHIHAMPLGQDISSSFMDANLHKKISDFYELKNLAFANNCAYLFYEDCHKERYYIKDKDAIFPSQFFRIQVANMVNHQDEWNWKTHPNYEEFLLTYNMLKGKIVI